MDGKRPEADRNEGRLTESNLDNRRMGRNSLQGDDQTSVRNQREALPEERQQADDLEESFRKLDKDVRARTDLGKGATRRP